MKVGAFSAVAAFALAAGGIAAALLIPTATTGTNIISAGHLVVEINHGDGSQISIDNMSPGETRTTYQLVTADMAGIGTAKLDMTLFGGDPASLFAQNATVTVAYSVPQPDSGLWDGTTCTPSGGYLSPTDLGHLSAIPAAQSSATPLPLGELTSTDSALCVRFEIGLDAAAGNDVQATQGAFSMNYSLTQTSAAP